MNLKGFIKDLDTALWIIKKLLIVCTGLTFIAVPAVIYSLSQHERIVLVPPHLDEKVELSWNKANAPYFKSWGLYVATLVGNITPSNSRFVIDQLSTMILKSKFGPIKNQLMEIGASPVMARGTEVSYFTPEKIFYEDKVSKVYVSGFLKSSSMAGDGGTKNESQAVTYEMGMKMMEGRPVITEFTSYPGMNPHTQEWWRTHPNGDKTTNPPQEASK